MYPVTATVAEAIQPNERTFQRKQYTVHYKLFFELHRKNTEKPETEANYAAFTSTFFRSPLGPMKYFTLYTRLGKGVRCIPHKKSFEANLLKKR